MSFLELNDVVKTYGDQPVLRGITAHVGRHEVVCLIGASGCGKSTLLRCVNGLEQIQSGDVRLEGDIVSGEGVDLNTLRRKVGIVFQSYNLFPHMSVLGNVALAPTKVLGMSRASAEERSMHLLERIGLADKAVAFPDQLSGGQQQRVAIVRALAMDPEVLLLDEITSALDPELVAEVLDIVRGLARSGLTIMMATHEMSFAREVSHRVLFLHEGVIHEEGTPEQLFGDPQTSRAQMFLRKIVEAGRL